jgi:hypothetical protein
VKFYCPSCGQKLSVDADMFGAKLQCPICNAWMKAPTGPVPSVQEQPVAVENSARSRRAIALWIGAGVGAVVIAGGLALAWWLGLLPGSENPPVPGATPEWVPRTVPPPSKSDPASIPPEQSTQVGEASKPGSKRGSAEPGPARANPPEPPTPVAPPRNEDVVQPEPVTPPPPAPRRQAERALSEDEKKKVFAQILAADGKAQQEAKRRIPDDPTHALAVGDSLRLTEKTLLHRAAPRPDAPQAEVEEAGKLPPGTTIRVAEVRPGRDTPWYRVDVVDKSGQTTGGGWVGAAWLTGQSREDRDARHAKQQRLQAELLAEYQRAVEEEHGITSAQVRRILSEGYENAWDGSKRSDITGD